MLIILAASAFPPIPQVEAYSSMLNGLRSGVPNVSVAVTFEAALDVRDALLRTEGDDGNQLERLSPSEFEALVKSLPGIKVNRELILYVQPDPAFFSSLAEKFGGPVDVEFFRHYTATLPGGVWKSYIAQQTDYSGCTTLGEGELVARYSDWLSFRTLYPEAYLAHVAEQIAAIEEEVAEGTCVCGWRYEAMLELEQFVRAFPESPVTPVVRKRIRELQRSTSRMRFDCISG